MPHRPANSDLPGWPAALSASMAAAYLSLSETAFLGLVKAGSIPKPVKYPIDRVVWRRDDLDAWLDRQSGRAPASAPVYELRVPERGHRRV